MNKQELIKEFEEIGIYKLNIFSTEIKTIPTETAIELIKQLDEPEPLPFKLKDVVRRIRGFDPTTQTRWLNDILKELGDDYGSMKYRSGYEQGKLEGEWVGNQLKDADKIRQELNKPVIPQFVAEIIEYCKKQNATLYDALREKNFNKQYDDWLLNEQGAYDKVARAWLDGYEVEKEKLYLVKIKGVNEECECLFFGELSNTWKFRSLGSFGELKKHHTRKELEEANFGWVFDCEGVEVEEVEE